MAETEQPKKDIDTTEELIKLVNEKNALNQEIAKLKGEAEDYKTKIADLEKVVSDKEANENRLNKLVLDNVVFNSKSNDPTAESKTTYDDAYADLMERMKAKKE